MEWDNCAKDVLDNSGKIIGSKVATIDCVNVVAVNIVNALLMFAGVATLAVFVIAGFRYMNSAGDPKKLESARGALIYGIIGLFVILFSFLIINVVHLVTGVEFNYQKILPTLK